MSILQRKDVASFVFATYALNKPGTSDNLLQCHDIKVEDMTRHDAIIARNTLYDSDVVNVGDVVIKLKDGKSI